MRVEFALEVATEVHCLHRAWNLELFQLAKLPSLRVPLPRQQVQTLRCVGNGRLETDELLRLVDVQVELFIVK